MPTLLIKTAADNVEDWKLELQARLPDVEVRVWPDAGNPADVDVAFMAGPPPGELAKYPNLKAFISLTVGVDGLMRDETIPPALPLARTVDPNLVTLMTGYIVYGVLRFHREFGRYEELQRERRWEPRRGRSNSECRVGILGLGQLGADSARVLHGMGYSVAGWSQTPKALDGVESFSGDADLGSFLARTDILVCLLPLTGRTRGIIDAGLIARLPSGASLINLARGAHVDEEALVSALDNGHLSGALLDVFSSEPLPDESPLWNHPKVIVTPHVAGRVTPATAAPQVAENVRRALAGEPLINPVDPSRGY